MVGFHESERGSEITEDVFKLDREATIAAVLAELYENDEGPSQGPEALSDDDQPAETVATWLGLRIDDDPRESLGGFLRGPTTRSPEDSVCVGATRNRAAYVTGGWTSLREFGLGEDFRHRTDSRFIGEVVGSIVDEANSLVPLARKIWPIAHDVTNGGVVRRLHAIRNGGAVLLDPP